METLKSVSFQKFAEKVSIKFGSKENGKETVEAAYAKLLHELKNMRNLVAGNPEDTDQGKGMPTRAASTPFASINNQGIGGPKAASKLLGGLSESGEWNEGLQTNLVSFLDRLINEIESIDYFNPEVLSTLTNFKPELKTFLQECETVASSTDQYTQFSRGVSEEGRRRDLIPEADLQEFQQWLAEFKSATSILEAASDTFDTAVQQVGAVIDEAARKVAGESVQRLNKMFEDICRECNITVDSNGKFPSFCNITQCLGYLQPRNVERALVGSSPHLDHNPRPPNFLGLVQHIEYIIESAKAEQGKYIHERPKKKPETIQPAPQTPVVLSTQKTRSGLTGLFGGWSKNKKS